MPPRRWAIRTAQAAAACVLVAIGLAVFIHAPPVRRAALRRVVAVLAERFDVVLRAESLSYSLFALQATLTNVEIASTRTPQRPFLTADRLEIAIPRSALFGVFSIDRLALDDARVNIVRRADGTTNLPSAEADAGEPQAVPIGRIQIPQLAVGFAEEAQDFALDIPALAVDIGRDNGTLRLNRPGRVRKGDIETTISALGGGVAFDGRAVTLTDMTVTTPEATVRAGGIMALLVEEPSADLRFAGSGDLTGVRRLIPNLPLVAGHVAVDGTLTGPLAEPTTNARIRSDALEWDRLTVSNVDAALQANAHGIRIPRFDAAIARGKITGSAEVASDSGRVDATLAWNDVDLEALRRGLRLSGPRPAATATGTASISGTGSDPRGWTVDARTQLIGRPRPRGQLALAGDTMVRLDDGRWQFELDGVVERAPLRAKLAGRVDARTPASSTVSGTVTASDVDLPAVLASLGDAGLVDIPPGTVTGGRVEGEAVLNGTLARPRLQIAARGRGLSAGGVADVAVDVNAEGTPQQMAVDARIRQRMANEVVATGTVWPDEPRVDFRVTGTVDEVGALLPDLPVEGVVALDLNVAGPASGIAAQGTVMIADATYAGINLGQLSASVQGGRDLVHIELKSNELAARGTADVALADRRAAIQLQVDAADLQRLLRDVEQPVPVEGRISLSARAEGPLDDWRRARADLSVSRFDARVGDLPVRLTSPARVAYRDQVVDIATLDAEIGETRLSMSGRIPAGESAPVVAAAEAVRAQLVGDVGQVLEAVRATGLTQLPDVAAEGPIALLARVTGTLERPVVAADLELGRAQVMVGDVPAVRLDEVRATVENGWIERVRVSGEWQESRFRADARIPLSLFRDHLPPAVVQALPATDGPATLTASATGITPAVLAPFLDPAATAQIAGGLDASLQIEMTSLDPATLRGEARLDRLDVRIAGLPVTQREPTRIAFDNGLARVVAWDWTGQGATLNVQGQIGLRDQQAAVLAAGQLDLRLLTPFVRTAGLTLAGTLSPRLSVFGSLADPRIDGEAALTDAEIRLRDPRVVATDLDAFAVLSPEQARITTLTGVVNGGSLSGSGELHYAPDAAASARIAGTIVGMGLEFPEGLRSELNADLSVALVGPRMTGGSDPEVASAAATAPSGRVTGTVTIARSAYREPIAVVAGLLTALRTERLVAAQADPNALPARMALDVRVVTDSDVVVDNNLARLQLGGDLRVIGTVAAPSLAGRADLREGGQLFLGRNVYTIDSGTIDFADPVAIVPDLDVMATTRAGGHDIELTLNGTPENLEVDLQSITDPQLSQADIASLLLTGRVLDNVAGREGDIVREQVLGYLSGDLLGIAGRTVGLDTIRLGGPDTSTLRRDAGAVASEADPTSRLTFGKVIGSDIELTYSQSLRDGGAQTWIVDYRPVAQLNLRLVSMDDDLRAYEFRHDVSVGGGSPERRGPLERARREPTIVAVTIAVDGGVSQERLGDELRLEPGDVFDFLEWQQDRDRLEQLLHREGRLEARVDAQRMDRDDGVALTYEIAAGPPTAIETAGFTLTAETRRRLEEAWTQSVFDDFLKEEAEAVVRAALADDGYLQPSLAVQVIAGQTKTLQITVDPGTRTSERRIVIEAGGDVTLARDLEQYVRQRGLDAAWRAPEELTDALAAELRSRGHVGARVTAGTPRVDNGVAILPLQVDAGSPFLFGEVGFTGAMRISPERLRAAAALVPATPYDPALVDAARRRIEVLYRGDGFIGTRISPDLLVNRDEGRVTIVFAIEEGQRQVLRAIDVAGNRGIDTDVITGALDLRIGQPLGADAWLQARARLFDTGLFRRVDVTVEPGEPQPGSDDRATRLRVVVEEWPTLRIRYGLQVSEERPEGSIEGRELTPGLSADVTRRTLFGRAVSVGAAAEYQRRERLARVFMNTPTLFGLPVESLLTAERSRRHFASGRFITDGSAMAWEQRTRVGTPLELSYAYRFERDHTFPTGPSDDPFAIFDVTVNIARLTGSAVFDTRDDPTETTRGWWLSSSAELSPQSLGSDVSFVRNVSQAYHFRPWRDVVFASAARIGLVAPRGGQTLIPSELFFSGGAHTVRGVVEESLGPRDFLGEIAGGQATLAMNHEIRFPVYRWMRGVAFLDAGNVFAQPRDIRLGKLVTAYGAGLRVTTPFALLRLDYGRLWTNASDLRRAQWTFGIGHTF